MKLLELIFVVMVIGLLALLAAPSFRKYQERAKNPPRYQMSNGVMCKHLVQERCGAQLTGCSDAQEYKCVHDLKVIKKLQ